MWLCECSRDWRLGSRDYLGDHAAGDRGSRDYLCDHVTGALSRDGDFDSTRRTRQSDFLLTLRAS